MKPEHEHHGQGPTGNPRDYHDTDIRLKPIMGFLVFTAIFTAITFFAVIAFYGVVGKGIDKARPSASSYRFGDEPRLPPEPRLQVFEKRTLQEQRAFEKEKLNGYGWVDQAAGVAHIPVDRAMELTAERGLPVREDAKGK